MRRALPAIALSAAGLTALLHAQRTIDASASTTAAGPDATGTPSAPSTTGNRSGPPAPSTSPAAPSATTSRSSAPATTGSPSTSAGGQHTVDGPVVNTRYGPVQVEVVVSGARVVDVKALRSPDEARRSQSINRQALPILHDEALSAQSARLDGVSGATYTSEGYAQSLQAALDSAGVR